MTSSNLIVSDESCHRAAYYSLRWEPPSLSPHAILRKSVEFGLTTEDDNFSRSAYDFCMQTCCETVIDSPEENLLDLATHIASLAEIIVYALRENRPWDRSPDVTIGESLWTSNSFTSAYPERLRGLQIVDRLDAMKELAIRHSWGAKGECSVHGKDMDVLVVVIGSLRNGRWTNPFTTARRHPVNRALRFRKRNGEDFGEKWDRVEREKDLASTADWYDALCDDGILPELVQVVPVEMPVNYEEIMRLAENKLQRIEAQASPPEPQLSRCFDRLHPCPYRSCCPSSLEPSEGAGFLKITASPVSHGHD